MMKHIIRTITITILLAPLAGICQDSAETAKPWVFWHWIQASVSKEGITADLEAMREAGIGGAYLMPIKGPAKPPLMDPPVEQLSAAWWEMVRHAMTEADRLGLKLGMHASDGFAVAGGPWITPALSMQKIVWTSTYVEGEGHFNTTLGQPETKEGYYRDIAVLALPYREGWEKSTRIIIPEVSTSKPGVDARFLVDPNNKESFRSDDSCWIQYTFTEPFTCRSIVTRTSGNNYQAHRLIIEASDDGKTFYRVGRLEAPRHGWQDTDADVTHAIKPTTARVFRFTYDREGSEPGAEDLDAAKWKPAFKIAGIELSGAPRLHQYEGKTGAVWRVSPRTTTTQVPDELSIPRDSILDLTQHLDAQGRLTWSIPRGRWMILRIGHTSTGHTNYTGGAGKGLECDKFNAEAVRLQYDRWFGEAVRVAGPELASRVLKILLLDSWECGSQNWSSVFREEFKRRRGYDLFPYLPAMAGIPVQSAAVSERLLYDVRQTITELVHDNFYGTLATLAHTQGCSLSSENVSPTMTSDGMLHFNAVDIPMGEFWWKSPTHDKPNDMLDAISAAHIYGKPLIQAEAFTTLRMAWDEHPGMLKAAGDRAYALGINRFVYHVFAHNPWTDRKPGMTLDGVGLYFQRDQTWWKPGKAWVDYAQRCQSLLQQGRPVADVAVFTGEELPRRALLPDRLVASLPGVVGREAVDREGKRLANEGQPLREIPDGVRHSANMADPRDWLDPLRGYAFDSFNKDALLRLAKVNNGRIELPGGASYGLLVIPGAHSMSPDGGLMSPAVASKLLGLVRDGATILLSEQPARSPGLEDLPIRQAGLPIREAGLPVREAGLAAPDSIIKIGEKLFGGSFRKDGDIIVNNVGKGRIIKGPYTADSFDDLGMARDVIVRDSSGAFAADIAWTHRSAVEQEIYFISNQSDRRRTIEISLRGKGRLPELYDPVTDEKWKATQWKYDKDRTVLSLRLDGHGSLFVLLGQPARKSPKRVSTNWTEYTLRQILQGSWTVTFDSAYGGPGKPVVFDTLSDWSKHQDPAIRYYSGTATYAKAFTWDGKIRSRVWLELGRVANLADVKVNGVSCGVAWTAPYRVEITAALKQGENVLEISVTNTWANRMIGDKTLPEDQRITKTTAPYRLEGKALLEAGLLGVVRLVVEE